MSHEDKAFARPQLMLTVGYIADKIHVVPHTVRKYIRLGILKATRYKGRWLVTVDDYEAFIKKGGS